jgi:hypothetical protein
MQLQHEKVMQLQHEKVMQLQHEKVIRLQHEKVMQLQLQPPILRLSLCIINIFKFFAIVAKGKGRGAGPKPILSSILEPHQPDIAPAPTLIL